MSDKDEKDEGKKTSIDWSKASDEQLAAAGAEAKRRVPLIKHEDVDWPALSGHEFARKRSEVFGAMRGYARGERVIREHAEIEAKREARIKREESVADE